MTEIKGTEITTTYKRVTPRPLDASSLFNDYESAHDYALNIDDEKDYCPHEGQVIAVKQTGALYRLRKNPSYYTTDESGNVTEITTDGKTGHFTLVELDQCVIFFEGMLEEGTQIIDSSYSIIADASSVYYSETANRFAVAAGQASIPSTPTYYSNWSNRIKWTDEQSLPLKEKIYACLSENVLYRYDEDQSKLVQIGGQGSIDNSLDSDSENPVQNKVITAKIQSLESFDTLLDSIIHTPPQITEYDLTFSSYYWVTIVLPFDFECPEGLEFYIVTGIIGDQSSGDLQTEKAASEGDVCKAHTPYLVKYLADEDGNRFYPKTFHLSGTFCSAYHHETYLRAGIAVGCYKQTKIYAGEATAGDIYYISKGKYWKMSTGYPLTMSPYKVFLVNRNVLGNSQQVTVDSDLDTQSENPVQNKVVATQIASHARRLNDIESEMETSLFTPFDESQEALTNYNLANEYIEGIVVEGVEYDETKPMKLLFISNRTIYEPDEDDPDSQPYVSINQSIGAYNSDGFSVSCYNMFYGYVSEAEDYDNKSLRVIVMLKKPIDVYFGNMYSKPPILGKKCFDVNNQVKIVSARLSQKQAKKYICSFFDSFPGFGGYKIMGSSDAMLFKYSIDFVFNKSDLYLTMKSSLANCGLYGLRFDKDFDIEASGEATIANTDFKLADGSDVSVVNGDDTFYICSILSNKFVNEAQIDAKYTSSGGNITKKIKRVDRSKALSIRKGDIIYRENIPAYDVAVICFGNNGGFSSVQEYLKLIEIAINNLHTDKYIIVTPFGGLFVSTLGIDGAKEIEQELAIKYGYKYLSARQYLINNMHNDSTITFSQSDQDRAASGLVPTAYIDTSYAPRYTDKPTDHATYLIDDRVWWIMNNFYF